MYRISLRGALLALGLTLNVPVAHAATYHFDVVLDSRTVDGSGVLEIGDSFFLRGGSALLENVFAIFTIGDVVFNRAVAGNVASWTIAKTGTDISGVFSPGPGRFVVYTDATGKIKLRFKEGAVRMGWSTVGLPGGDLTGSYSLTYDPNPPAPPAPAPVPEPPLASAPLPAPVPLPLPGVLLAAVLGLAGLAFGRRRVV